jgi:hypothetical protein
MHIPTTEMITKLQLRITLCKTCCVARTIIVFGSSAYYSKFQKFAIPVSTSATASSVTANTPGNTQSKTADFKTVPKKCSIAKTRTACKPAATQSSSPVEPVTLEADYKPVASSTPILTQL